MATPPLSRRSLLLSILFVVLAAGAPGLPGDEAGVAPRGDSPRSTASGGIIRAVAASIPAVEDGPAVAADDDDARRAGEWSAAVRGAVAPTRIRPSLGRGATVRPDLQSAVRMSTVDDGSSAQYAGRNHVWIPALGIDRSVSPFPCTRTRPPDNLVYRWGCAGKNNVYLLGHAYSVFEPLHDAYVNKTLRKGMEVVYADGAGRVRTYTVTWWRVTAPTTAASWAWAPQSRPSMTLQTCVGADGEYRLIVRLVARD